MGTSGQSEVSLTSIYYDDTPLPHPHHSLLTPLVHTLTTLLHSLPASAPMASGHFQVEAALLMLPLVMLVLNSGGGSAAGAVVPAVIVFGDSTVDTGNNNVIGTVLKSNFPPYGRDFEGGVATGRFTNGRLVTDFMSEALGLATSVPAYLDGSYTIDQLAGGVSFASGGTGLDTMTAKLAVSY